MAVLAGLLATLIPASPVLAVEKDCLQAGVSCTPGEVEAQIKKVWLELEPAIERHNATKAQLEQNKAKVAEYEQQLAPLRARVDKVMSDVSLISVAAYKSNPPASKAVVIISSGSVDGFMDGLTLLDGIASGQQALIKDALVLKRELEEQEAPYNAAVARLAAQEAELAQQASSIRQGVDQLNDLRRKVYATTNGQGSLRPAPCPYSYDGSAASEAAKIACQQVGKPYVWATGENGGTFDCSGLVLYSWRQATGGKVNLPHYTRWQYDATSRVSRAELKPGDLVFYYAGNTHVAVYEGGGWVMEAASPGLGVIMSRIDAYPIYGYGRVKY